ncbi:MAG: histidine kinase [Desulfobacterales bacterium]|nr:MAG: histidine kinase [Desulfobacterales bacterium]
MAKIRISLRGRIYLILTCLALINLAGALVLVAYTYRMEGLLASITERNLAAFQAAEALETALVNQKGFVSYYFMDGNPDWLRQLERYRQIFQEHLNEVRVLVDSEPQAAAVREIEAAYQLYVTQKDRVIELYKAGDVETGATLHQKVRENFFRVLDLCEKYKKIHQEKIVRARAESQRQAANLRFMAVVAMLAAFLLTLLLAFVLVNQILGPVRRLTAEADRAGDAGSAGDEVKALSRSVRGLIEDVDYTQSELAKSREHLLQAEKMALVGKLAAGMAHSIRNPFTSVKMRLFSLSRSLELADTQKEDFEVISEEIRHIDTIVQNFLEFSRPPKLKMQPISPSAVVDSAIQLLEHRLKSYEVTVAVERGFPLPEIAVDPEQLKEVLVNLVVNACEAMDRGGSITIREEEAWESPSKRVAVIRVRDSGPGIPDAIREKIFQPFFTTKEEGTGLGLSIAARIMEDHKGRLEVSSQEGQGASFTITLPITAGVPRDASAAAD